MNRKHLISILVTVTLGAIAACGGKSKGDTTTPDRTGGTSMPDGGSATATTTTTTPDATAPADDGHEALLAAEKTAYQAAQPVFQGKCGSCHVEGGASATAKKLDHINMTAYPFTGEHTATITVTIRHVLGIDGSKPIMPKDKPGSVQGADLALIAAWADAYDAADNAGAHGEHDDGHADHHHDHDD